MSTMPGRALVTAAQMAGVWGRTKGRKIVEEAGERSRYTFPTECGSSKASAQDGSASECPINSSVLNLLDPHFLINLSHNAC
jgi:hypothetical protein